MNVCVVTKTITVEIIKILIVIKIIVIVIIISNNISSKDIMKMM